MKPIINLGEAAKRMQLRHIKRLILEDPASAVAHIRSIEKEWDREDAISLGTQRRKRWKPKTIRIYGRDKFLGKSKDHPVYGWNE